MGCKFFSNTLLHIRELHGFMHQSKVMLLPLLKWRLIHPRSPFLLFTPEHGNIGDHAIALAEKKLLDRFGLLVHEITGANLFLLIEYGWLKILNGSPLIFHGGGYIGTLWYHDELAIRKIILQCPDSKIVFLPCTAYFENNTWGKQELEESTNIYRNHQNILMVAREKTTELLLQKFCKRVLICPDVVLSLNESRSSLKRSGCLLCMRSDAERLVSDKEMFQLKQIVELSFCGKVTITDMVEQKTIRPIDRLDAVYRKLEAFKSTQIVITDRLHALLIATITGTPCIVINSKSHKVSGSYAWLDKTEYIYFANDISDVGRILEGITLKQYEYSQPFENDYAMIMTEIKRFLF